MQPLTAADGSWDSVRPAVVGRHHSGGTFQAALERSLQPRRAEPQSPAPSADGRTARTETHAARPGGADGSARAGPSAVTEPRATGARPALAAARPTAPSQLRPVGATAPRPTAAPRAAPAAGTAPARTTPTRPAIRPRTTPEEAAAALTEAMARENVPDSWRASLEFIMHRESRGQIDARNPVHSARGLYQLTRANYHFNPRGEASFGNGTEEAQGGIRYIRRRYGTADKAVAHWQKKGWY